MCGSLGRGGSAVCLSVKCLTLQHSFALCALQNNKLNKYTKSTTGEGEIVLGDDHSVLTPC